MNLRKGSLDLEQSTTGANLTREPMHVYFTQAFLAIEGRRSKWRAIHVKERAVSSLTLVALMTFTRLLLLLLLADPPAVRSTGTRI